MKKFSITIGKKRHEFSLEKIDKNTTFLECAAAKISQPFDNGDLAEVIFYLPDYILQNSVAPNKEITIRFRANCAEKLQIEKKAAAAGISVSELLRRAVLS